MGGVGVVSSVWSGVDSSVWSVVDSYGWIGGS